MDENVEISEVITEDDLHVGDTIEVLWDDAACWYKESIEEDWADEQHVLTWGLIVKKTEKSLFLASELQIDNGTYRGVTRIPWPYILRVGILKKAEHA